MTRRLACCAAIVLALASASSAAPSRPFISDPRGDWRIGSQDIVSGTIGTDRAGRVVVSLTMAAPLAELPGGYYFYASRSDCEAVLARLEWRGASLGHVSELDLVRWCDPAAPGVVGQSVPVVRATMPAPATVAGATITWTLPQIPELARGTLLRWPYAAAAPTVKVFVGLFAGGPFPTVSVEAYDAAVGRHDYAVGGGAR